MSVGRRYGGMKLHHCAVITALVFPLAACSGGMSLQHGTERFQGGVGDAVAAPLEDLNLRRAEVPETLIEARYRPYGIVGITGCVAIAAEITKLDEALGPDLDSGLAPDGSRTDEQAADAALGLVRDTTTDFIPFRSWVRRLTGAHAHSQEVERAYRAGLTRRAYLKGMGQQQGCAPPAAPTVRAVQP